MHLRTFLTATALIMAITVVELSYGQASRPARITGTLVRIEGRALILRNDKADGTIAETELTTTANTIFLIDGVGGTIDDLRPGMMIQSPPARGAMPRQVLATSVGLDGVVVKIDGNTMVLRVTQPAGDSKDVTVATNDDTQVSLVGTVARGAVSRKPQVGNWSELAGSIPAGASVTVIPPTGFASSVRVGMTMPTSAPSR